MPSPAKLLLFTTVTVEACVSGQNLQGIFLDGVQNLVGFPRTPAVESSYTSWMEEPGMMSWNWFLRAIFQASWKLLCRIGREDRRSLQQPRWPATQPPAASAPSSGCSSYSGPGRCRCLCGTPDKVPRPRWAHGGRLLATVFWRFLKVIVSRSRGNPGKTRALLSDDGPSPACHG